MPNSLRFSGRCPAPRPGLTPANPLARLNEVVNCQARPIFPMGNLFSKRFVGGICLRKFFVLLFILGSSLGCFTAWAQDQTTPPAPVESGPRLNALTSLAGTFFNGDYFNFYGFVDGVYDSTQQTLQNNNNQGGAGFSIGGGVTGTKTFSSSVLSVNYRGEYRDYASGFSGNGTDQYLTLLYTKRFGRRWTISLDESAGILFYSNAYFGNLSPGGGGGVQTNPFSPTTRFLMSGITASYRQTQRLTYTVTGNFFLNRYSYPGSIGSTGGIVSASAIYQLTSRTSFGGTYSHDEFVFQHGQGNTHVDGGYANVSHRFGRTWLANASFGYTRAHSVGIITIPVQVIIGGQPVTGYVTGPYDTVRYVPTYTGNLSHTVGHFTLAVNGGHSVNPGNGTYLTSANTFFGGVVSRSFPKSSLSASFTYSRLQSIANQVSSSYGQFFMNASYSRILYPHVSAYVAYQYDRYNALLQFGSSSLNRIIVGLNFSTKNVPMVQF